MNKKTNKNEMKIVRRSVFDPAWVKTVFLPFFVVFLISLVLCFFGFKYLRQAKTNSAAKKPIISKQKNIPRDKMREAIEAVNGLYVDPYTLTRIIDNDPSEIALIDLREKRDYDRGHIKTSLNYSTSGLIKDLKSFGRKKIVLYGHNSNDPLPREVALEVMGGGRDVRLLSVGWTEFRHFRNLWIPESKWDELDLDKYID